MDCCYGRHGVRWEGRTRVVLVLLLLLLLLVLYLTLLTGGCVNLGV